MTKLEQIEAILEGIGETELDSNLGWWETSTGAEFGKEKLEAIRELFKRDQDEK